MHCSSFLSQNHWPASYIPETVFQHFLDTKYYTEDREYLDLYEPEELLKALKSNEKFSKFWTQIQEQHPEKKDYFLSLTNEDEEYDPYWIECEYEAYQQQNAFDALAEEERKTLQNEFDEFRPAAFQAALEGESNRLNCDLDDIRPTNPVLPWESDHEEESILARLPNELFGRIFPLLETLDIFRMTLVCKRWKRLVYDNSMDLKKAEYAVTTHLITFTEWMDPLKTPNNNTFLHQYQTLSKSLIRWFCGISENLESLILDHHIPHTSLSNLLQSCPRLKHLRIRYDSDRDISPPDTTIARVKLKKLEVFVTSPVHYWHGCFGPFRDLHRDILASSPSLRVFKGPVNSEDFFAIDIQNPVSNVFSKLIALDLEKFTASSLEILAHIENLQIKYLRLGCHDCDTEVDGLQDEERTRKAFHQLLPKLKRLEMLRTSYHIGVTNETIQLMTDLELTINWAVLHQSYFPMEYDDEDDGIGLSMEKDPLQPEVLAAFRSMLLTKNPDMDLSEIQLILREGKTLEALEARNTGFTIVKTNESDFPTTSFDELYDPKIQQRLGISY